jgi:hypothetical protein
MSMTLNLTGFNKLTRDQLAKNFVKGGIYFASKMRGYLNTDQPYIKRGKHYTGLSPSAPGAFPHKLTGQLQKSITWSFNKPKLILTVGSNLKGYPSYLQKGTRRMKPRPWLTLCWNKEKARLGRILVTGK